MKINYKTILLLIGVFVIGMAFSIWAEDFYRQFIRQLYKIFNGESIQYVGKNFHLFPSYKFVYSFGFYCSLTFAIINFFNKENRLKALLVALITIFGMTILMALADSKRLVIECTNCKDGIKLIHYNGISYDLYFICSLIFSLIAILIVTAKKPKPVSEKYQPDKLIGLWTKEDDGSGLLAIFGWSYEFRHDGTGVYHFWEGSNKDNHCFEFEWKRINENTVMVKRSDSINWNTLCYQLEDVSGAYNSKATKLTEIGKKDFWNSTEPLFKRQ